jgi:sec-independent protein translocase protein TatC
MLVTFESESLEQSITAGFYFSFVTKMLLAFGVVFELPVVVLVLSALGLVTASWLRSKRRYAVAGMAVLSAVITPGDAISLTLFLMVPLLLLYEMSIGLAALVERARRRHAVEDAEAEAEAVGAT